MSSEPETSEEIAFKFMSGMLLALFYYFLLFGIAYLLEKMLSDVELTITIVLAHAGKYLLLLVDIILFSNFVYTEARLGTARINKYRGKHL